METLSAQQFHEEFIVRLDTIKDLTNTDMAALFFTNFSPEYRKAMEAMGFTLPQHGKGLKEKRNQAGKRIMT
eukprot:2512920-Ditylum_brightwellii.AAC.1